MASRYPKHDYACEKSRLMVTSFDDLPASRQLGAMFTMHPPSILPRVDRVKYGHQYNKLVKALNMPPGTTRGKSTDVASRSRFVLWDLWFKARALKQAQHHGLEEGDSSEDDSTVESDSEEEDEENGGEESPKRKTQSGLPWVHPRLRTDLPEGWLDA